MQAAKQLCCLLLVACAFLIHGSGGSKVTQSEQLRDQALTIQHLWNETPVSVEQQKLRLTGLRPSTGSGVKDGARPDRNKYYNRTLVPMEPDAKSALVLKAAPAPAPIATIATNYNSGTKVTAAECVGGVALLAMQGGSSEEIAKGSAELAVNLAISAIGSVNPLLGVVMSLTSSFIFGLFGGEQDSPEEALYTAIMSQVNHLIKQTLIQEKMTSAKNMLLGLSDELAWIPHLLQDTSDDIQVSYYLNVQHDMAVGARDAFGACYDDMSSSDCDSWEEAGTIAIINDYAMSHIETLSTLYTLSTSESFTEQIQKQLMKIGMKYKGLLKHSLEAFIDKRSAQIGLTTEQTDFDPNRNINTCTSTITDTSTGEILYESKFKRKNDCSHKTSLQKMNTEFRETLKTTISNSALNIYSPLTSYLSCSVYSCPSDYVLRTNAENVKEYSLEDCCLKTCALYSCPLGYTANNRRRQTTGAGTTADCCTALGGHRRRRSCAANNACVASSHDPTCGAQCEELDTAGTCCETCDTSSDSRRRDGRRRKGGYMCERRRS